MDVDKLVEELHSLVGSVVTEKKFSQVHILRELGKTRQGIVKLIEHGVNEIDGDQQIDHSPKIFKAVQVREALTWLLLKQKAYLTPERRRKAMDILGLHWSVETWKRGAELSLLRILAHILVQQPAEAGFIVEWAEWKFFIDERFVVTRRDAIMEIRAERPMTKITGLLATYPSDPRAIKAEAIYGCSVDSKYDEYSKALDMTITTGALKPDQTHVLGYRIIMTTDVPADPKATIEPVTRYKKLTMKLAFDREPPLCWWFSRMSRIRAPGKPKPGEAGNLLKSHERTFSSLDPPWCYGLAWRV
jgi:hypothetical protein